uniref:Extracellular solute-binding protein family 3 n=1 Tax=Cyanothece sp. (strain PCC 7425 / ATCC 29141) TaxID=395961 RepID=B8HSH7_CYAP4
MWNKWSALLLGLLLTTALPQAVKAETVIEKITRTGVLSVGTRLGMLPYAYIDDRQQLVGLSVDLTNLIKEEIQQELGRPVTIQVQVIDNPNDYFRNLGMGTIDIACSAQFTWQRAQFVDFSIPYSISGIRLLLKRDSQLSGTVESLAGQRVGVVPNSMGEVVMKAIQPKAVLVPVQGADEGIADLQSGKIAAIAGDSLILAGNALKANPNGFRLTPTQPYARYGIACIVPENNSTFLNLVNRAIAKLMQGYIIGDQKSVALIDQWVGPNGLVPLPPELIRSYFETVIMSHEQIPLTPATAAKP